MPSLTVSTTPSAPVCPEGVVGTVPVTSQESALHESAVPGTPFGGVEGSVVMVFRLLPVAMVST